MRRGPNRATADINSLDLLKSAVWIRCTYASAFDRKTAYGTGFFVLTEPEQRFCLVTNRHLVDTRLIKGPVTDFELDKLEIGLRTKADHLQDTSSIFRSLSDPRAYHALNAPVVDYPAPVIALFVSRNFSEGMEEFWIDAIPESSLATHRQFIDLVRPMDQVSFVGFPGTAKSEWWDTRINLAISRTGYISSLADGYFSNQSVMTSNVVVVSGLSFAGSSGSIVVAHDKTLTRIEPDGKREDTSIYAMVVGVMSGHWWEASQTPIMFEHSGLSYFTRSSSICKILEGLRQATSI